MLRTFFSEEVSKVGALVLLLRLLDPPADGGVVDAELLGRLLEGVVHCVLAHLLLEPVEAVLAALLVQGDHGELLLAAPCRRAQVLQRVARLKLRVVTWRLEQEESSLFLLLW